MYNKCLEKAPAPSLGLSLPLGAFSGWWALRYRFRMMPRHAAAFALVGWYLMTPALLYFPKGTRDINGQPIPRWVIAGWGRPGQPEFSQWNIMGSYDTAVDCEAEKAALALTVPAGTQDPEAFAAALPQVKKSAQCIATDDPRLKEKTP